MTTRGSWLDHALNRGRWGAQRQVIALATVGLFVAIIMSALYLSQAASTATTRRQLEGMIAQRNELEQQNEQLRAEIAVLQSMPRLQARAEAMGFVPATAADIEYIVVPGYNPQRDVVVVPLTPQEAPLPDYDESFGGWLEMQLDMLRDQIESFTRQEGS